MLVVFQFPIADLRRFVPVDTHRLVKPAWPVPRPDKDFVRAFGHLCKRSLGGVEDWPGEDYFCEAARGIRMADGWQSKTGSFLKTAGRARCAFRRLLADGMGVTRVEIAFDFREADLLKQVDAVSCLRSFSGISVHIRNSDQDDALPRWKAETRIGVVGRSLARHYLHSTTRRRLAGIKPSEWWVQSCEPAMVIQHVRGQFVQFPNNTRKIELPILDIDLHYLRWQQEGTHLSVWFLGFTPGVEKDFARRLRLHVLRLHAEVEFLRQLLRSIVEEELAIDPRTQTCDALQEHLSRSIRLLSRESRFGVPQSDLLKALLDYRELLSPGERETLLSQTQALRGNIKRSLARFTQQAPPQVSVTTQSVQIDQFREKNVSDQRILFGNNATVSNSVLTAAATVRESSLSVQSSDSTPELKARLVELHSAVQEMIGHLNPEQAAAAARDLAQFTQETVADHPRRRWYELTSQGLVDAAKAVGAVATPVITAVTAILKFLNP